MTLTLNTFLLLFGTLLLLGIASSKFSARLGMPVLILFLGVGMLAGSEGPGGIPFTDFVLANSLGSAALALILYDGGLRTPWASVRSAWKPALSLSTVGVFVTSVLTGLAASRILDIPLLHGMLLGSIVGSTDAAAVFSVLRTSGQQMPERLTATLEVESGSNDPMAIFMTVGILGILTGDAATGVDLMKLIVMQFGIGAGAGVLVGLAAVYIINRINLDHPGLYPILALAFGLLSFGLASVLGGSGFLSVYISGILIGNKLLVFRRGIFLVHDAAAWLSQIVLFIMLGMLSFPSELFAVTGSGLLTAFVLIFVARPVSVALSVWPFGFGFRELVFLSWVGLKGAVPITLATFPLMAGLHGGALLFNIVFFVVLVSAITQGWSLTYVARWLKLAEPRLASPPLSLEINALRHVNSDIVEYTVAPSARVAGQMLQDLALPDGVVVTIVIRGDEVIIPKGKTALRPDDHIFITMRSELKPLLDRLFDPYAETPEFPADLRLSFRSKQTIGQLHRFFGIPGPTWSTDTVGSLLASAPTGTPARMGDFLVEPADDPDFVVLTYRPLIMQSE